MWIDQVKRVILYYHLDLFSIMLTKPMEHSMNPIINQIQLPIRHWLHHFVAKPHNIPLANTKSKLRVHDTSLPATTDCVTYIYDKVLHIIFFTFCYLDPCLLHFRSRFAHIFCFKALLNSPEALQGHILLWSITFWTILLEGHDHIRNK